MGGVNATGRGIVNNNLKTLLLNASNRALVSTHSLKPQNSLHLKLMLKGQIFLFDY